MGFELGVEIAASIGVHLLERGFRLRCDRVADPDPRCAVDSSGRRIPDARR